MGFVWPSWVYLLLGVGFWLAHIDNAKYIHYRFFFFWGGGGGGIWLMVLVKSIIGRKALKSTHVLTNVSESGILLPFYNLELLGTIFMFNFSCWYFPWLMFCNLAKIVDFNLQNSFIQIEYASSHIFKANAIHIKHIHEVLKVLSWWSPQWQNLHLYNLSSTFSA